MSSNSLMPFAFGESLVRIITDDNGELLFIAKDVALALGYTWAKIATIKHVPEEWRRVRSVLTLSVEGGNVEWRDRKRIPAPHIEGGNSDLPPHIEQDMHVLTEQGLYFFLGRSDKKRALPFQKWLAGEVLPSIRRTGGYSLLSDPGQPPLMLPPAMPDAVKRLKPLLRERVLSDAIQTARLTNLTTQEEIDALFLRYCAMIADAPEAGRVRLPGMAFARDTEGENIRRFAEECLAPCRGNRVNATDMYVAFRSWWRDQFDAALPSHHRFGKVMHEICAKIRRGGQVWYVNVAFKE